jgi:putative membrane protein
MDAPNSMEVLINIKYIVNALVFSVLGIVILIFSFFVFDKMTPGNLWKEVVEEKNIALAITAGAMALAIAQIIASAIHS